VDAPEGSISTESTKRVLACTCETFIVDGSDRVYAPLVELTVIWLVVPTIEDINAAPYYRI